MLLFFISSKAEAQKTGYIFRHLSTVNGLVSNVVLSVLHDRKGFVWIGTQTGLQRYDGKRFINYHTDVHNPDALQSDWISSLFEDSKSRLWIGTSVSGAGVLNRATGKFYNFNLHLANGAEKINGIIKFLEDRQGNIWLAAYTGYYRFNEQLQIFQPVNDLLQMANYLPSSIAMDKRGDLWFSTTGGIKKWEVNSNKLFDRNYNPAHLAIFNIKEPVSNISFDGRNNIWISTGYLSGLFRFNINQNIIHNYSFNRLNSHTSSIPEKEFTGELFTASNGEFFVPLLSRGIAFYNYEADSFLIMNAAKNNSYGLHLGDNSYSSIIISEDKQQNIWMGTDEGINVFNLNRPLFSTYGLPESSMTNMLPPSDVSDLLQTKTGDIYTSNYFANGGIKKFDKNFEFRQQYLVKTNSASDLAVNQLWCLFQDDKGMIWAPNQAGSITMFDPATKFISNFNDSLLHGAINCIQQDNDKNIWVASERKGLIKIAAADKRITLYQDFFRPEAARKRVKCFLFDNDKIWVGTILNGLQLFDPASGKYTASYLMDERNNQSINNNNVMGILSYSTDTLIVATQGGINIFNKKTKVFTSISAKDGLPNNLTQAIILDDNKSLWAAFAGGLSKIQIPSLNIINYNEDDGIIDNKFNNSILKLKDGRLMIGASKSFLVFDPGKLAETKAPPNVTITGFTVFGKTILTDSLVNTATAIMLPYFENSFHIEFSSLQFNSSAGVKYFYQLQGIDKNWMPASDELSVNYNQLPPGNYVFSLKCKDRFGTFCKNITTLSVNITPPFWKRWWFLALAAAVLLACLYAIVKWREKNIKELEAGKTTLQQLTAEKYKTQFESEQVSNFFSSSLLNKNDVDDVLWDVAKNLIGKMGFVDCMIYLWNEDGTRLVQKAGYGPKGSLEELESKHFEVLPGQGVVGTVAQTGEALLIPDTTRDKRYRIDDVARLSEICVPIKYNEQIIGIIDSEHYEKNFFTRQHLQVLTTIATLVASKIKSIESEQSLRHQKAELADINRQLSEVQLAALRSQMNPHFIFNALNSIKKFVIANEPANAEKYLGKFAKLIRSILDNSQTGMVTIEKELQLLHLYLELEQLRFGTKLSYSIEVDEKINKGDMQIPSMIVQPFVENAMLHGIMHRQDAGKVLIRFLQHTSWIEIIIEDNGVGRAKSVEYKSDDAGAHQSIGIEVATKRLQALKTDMETPAGIFIDDLYNEAGEGIGTRIIISIPTN